MTARLRSRTIEADIDSERAFLVLHAADAWCFWLDPGHGAARGRSVMGAAREGCRRLVAGGGTVRIERLDAGRWVLERESAEDPLTVLAEELPPPARGGSGDIVPGWVGWLGYETGARIVGAPWHAARTPDVVLLEVDRVVIVEGGSARAVVRDDAADGEDWLDVVERALLAAAARPASEPASTSGSGVDAQWRHGAEEYRSLIRRCLESIREGDAYQLCLTNEVVVDAHPDPVELFRVLRRSQPAPHAGLLRFGDVALVSASPESFLRVEPDGTVWTSPIKGTRPRHQDPQRDRSLYDELRSSEKERAENLMIVDLMRNDLGRVAESGTVTVAELFAVESYTSVHQLVSTVMARLPEGAGAVQALAACLPPGSMTGAPKHRALTILDELEAGPRGIYSGVFGWIGEDGSADLAVVIRSVVLTPAGASIGTGGGITASSDPDEELRETRVKAAPLLEALGASSTGPR